MRLRRTDAAFALGLCAVAEAEVTLAAAPWSATPVRPLWLTVLFTLFMTLPLAFARDQPLPALLVVLGAAVLQGLLAAPPESVAVMVAWVAALYMVGRWEPGVRARAGLAAGLGAAVALTALGAGGTVADYLAAAFVPTVPPWLAGALRARHVRAQELEVRTARLEHEREAQTRVAVEAERARIARELHDVVAHSVSTMVVQAQASESLIESQPDRARAALAAVVDSGRGALVELRHLLGLLRDADAVPSRAPQPTLAQLGPLVESMTRAGLTVHVELPEPVPALPPGLDLAAYRIIQEALTNSLRHGSARRVDVHVRCGDELTVEVVESDGNARAPGGVPGGTGSGLVGMRERAAVYGGRVEAGPQPSGGFRVAAYLPLREVRA